MRHSQGTDPGLDPVLVTDLSRERTSSRQPVRKPEHRPTTNGDWFVLPSRPSNPTGTHGPKTLRDRDTHKHIQTHVTKPLVQFRATPRVWENQTRLSHWVHRNWTGMGLPPLTGTWVEQEESLGSTPLRSRSPNQEEGNMWGGGGVRRETTYPCVTTVRVLSETRGGGRR